MTPTETLPKVALSSGGRMLIGSDWREAQSGKRFKTLNPATGDTLLEVAEGDAPDVDLAVQAARRAFEGPWGKMSASERGRLLWKLGDLINAKASELAQLETLDTGKPIWESSKIDIPLTVDVFYYFAGAATKLEGDTIPVSGPYLNYTVREPLGVVGLIVPWNFPLLLAARKVAPALAAGNTVILKPAEETPLTALRLGELALEAGIPPGVLNVVPGFGPTAGGALVAHAGVSGVAFTGETTTGRLIMQNAARSLKKVSLELGGKSPNIVFADADQEAAARGTVFGIFYNKGEVCTAGSRLFVERGVHDSMLEKVIDRAQKYPQGDPLDPKTRLGAQTSEAQIEKISRYVEIGKKEGAKLVLGGEPARVGNGRGYFWKPTIFDQVTNTMTIAREEIFGPVLSVISFDDFDRALEEANDSFYGLSAAVWTRDIKNAHRAARMLQAGTVWINTYNMYDAASPYGGYKGSGFGRESGMTGLDFYTQTKSVWVDLS
ncbi:MAG: aldehyde dehydrogenase family protein [Candidatus Eisenbacteria bacterium]|uniref:Aldehyde dehydrogenase family protein n=1 Tax=Eiseniibacteriota bacterium TaxID=2212470 RepID=A0A538S9X5_UNCEI|nr:MAG: aldehyde dehydrogenase family protein [Candidatus Eisenbacteria bacterium]